MNRRTAARLARWAIVIALYGAGVLFASSLNDQPASAHRASTQPAAAGVTASTPAAAAATGPASAPEAPLVTLGLVGGAAATFAVWRFARMPSRRRRGRLTPRAVMREPVIVRR